MKPSVFCIFFLAVLAGCTSPGGETVTGSRPNIIWLVAEDISPALGCYGDDFATTPNIDRLAQMGIVYEKAYATAPICAPSRSCLVSGLYAVSLGTQHLRCEVPFPDQLKTLPESMHDAGYFTTNRNKTDYNFDPEGLWDHWSASYAPWRKRTDPQQPFFSFINVGPSHEGSVNVEESYQKSIADLDPGLLHDPGKVTVPPYYPENEETREVWAHYYDVMTALDQNVGKILDSLEEDGLLDETIILFFGDHGFGMPRYKRWLYHTGIHVPLVISAPEKYQHLLNSQTEGSRNTQLVSFVDFAPTTLNLAGAELPPTMQGQPFLGKNLPAPRSHIFAARDRADDMYEMSRAVFDGRYLYIRHFMPHLPPIQPGFIYSDRKVAFRALRKAHLAGETNAEQKKLWSPKPVEELYDLKNDPQELNNLAGDPSLAEKQSFLKDKLFAWMMEVRDLGLLPEAEYMMRSADVAASPYEYTRQGDIYPVEEILRSAEMVGKAPESALIENLKHEDSGVRYWAVVGLQNFSNPSEDAIVSLQTMLGDSSPSVQIAAAEVILGIRQNEDAVKVLGKWVQDDRPWLALQAARSIQLAGENASPLIPVMYQVLEKNLSPPGGERKYKDFNFAAFTSWSLEWALQELGEDIQVN